MSAPAPEVAPLSLEEIAAETARHAPMWLNSKTHVCYSESYVWPCPTARLLATLAQSTVDLETLQGANILNKNTIKSHRSTIEAQGQEIERLKALTGKLHDQCWDECERLKLAQTLYTEALKAAVYLRSRGLPHIALEAAIRAWHLE